MLNIARARLDRSGLEECSVRHGDIFDLALPRERSTWWSSIRCCTTWATAPRAVAEAARLVAPGGRLLIVDFAPHDLEFLRAEHAIAGSASRRKRDAGWQPPVSPASRQPCRPGRTARSRSRCGRPRPRIMRRRRRSRASWRDERASRQPLVAPASLAGIRGLVRVLPAQDRRRGEPLAGIRRLEPLEPEFVSVTYGAGGSTRERTHRTVMRMLRRDHAAPAAHLTCVDASRAEVDAVIEDYWNAGIRHIVALRGDPPGALGGAYRAAPDGYANATELAAGIAAHRAVRGVVVGLSRRCIRKARRRRTTSTC